MIFLITNNAKVTLLRSATHMVPLNFVPPKKKQENVFQLFLKIKGLHFVNKISTKTRPKRTSFANCNTKVNPAVPSEPRHFVIENILEFQRFYQKVCKQYIK